MKGTHVARPTTNRSRSERNPAMKNQWMNGVMVACGLVLSASVALADKAAIEKKAQETKVTLSFKQMAVDQALDMVSMMGGIAIKKTDIPKDAPKVTAELKDVSVLEGIKLITQLAGLTYTVVDDGIEVSGKKKD
jgi:galactitol-specific phosphotransferase system IIB component